MKTFLIGFIALISVQLKAQEMNTPQQTVIDLFIATDQRDWEKVEHIFSDQVKLDYSSMNGQPASLLAPNDIIQAWQTILPDFEHTHHQVANFSSQISEEKALVSCYGTASHYLQSPNGNLWIVVGSYDFDLVKKADQWHITAMTFHFKYQEGNLSLPQLAMDKVKGIEVPTSSIVEQNKESVKAFFKALEDKNIDQLTDLFAADAVHVNPYASGLFSEGAKGKEEIKAYWQVAFANFGDMSFPIDQIYAMEDPSLVFIQYAGVIQLKDGPGTYENNYYSLFKFDQDGLITEYVEIFNPIVAARGFGLIDKIK